MLKPEAATRKDIAAGMATLEHRHLATIATILQRIAAPADMVAAFADELRHTNPRFDRSRFLRAVKGN